MHQIQDGGLDRAAARPRTDAPRDTRPAPIGDRLRHGVALARDGHVGEALAVVEALLAHPDPDVEDLVLALATAQDCRLARGDLGDALALGDGSRRTSRSPVAPAPSPSTPPASCPRP